MEGIWLKGARLERASIGLMRAPLSRTGLDTVEKGVVLCAI